MGGVQIVSAHDLGTFSRALAALAGAGEMAPAAQLDLQQLFCFTGVLTTGPSKLLVGLPSFYNTFLVLAFTLSEHQKNVEVPTIQIVESPLGFLKLYDQMFISCFQVDIGPIFKISENVLDGSSSFVGPHLF